MTCAKIENLCMNEGDTNPIQLTLSSGGVAIDITGYTFYLSIKRNKLDADSKAVISKTVTSLTDPTNGIVTITIVHDDTLEKYGDWYYDIKFDTGAPLRTTILYGDFQIVQAVGDF